MNIRPTRLLVTNSVIGVLLATLVAPISASASTQQYEFETEANLTENFNVTVGPNTSRSDVFVQQGWGLGGTGGLRVDLGNPTANRAAILGSTTRYTVNGAPDNSVYKFSLYAKSFEGGYAGMGFSANPSVTSSGVYPDRFTPTDALGVSLHGGGFFFHNGATDITGNWNGSGNPGSITPITTANCSIFIDSPEFVPTNPADDDCASTSGWYRMDMTLTKRSASTFDLKIEVFRSSATGDIVESGNSNADASFEMTGLSNPAIGNAESVSSYINYSGKRFPAIDSYSVTLSGGSSFVAPPAQLPQQAPAMMSVIDVNPTNITVDNEIITILGANLHTATEVYIGGIKVPIFTKSGNRLQIRAPKGLTGLVDLEIKSSLNDVLLTKELNFGGVASEAADRKTLVVKGFAPNSRKLSARMKAKIDRWLDRNSDLSTLTCIGFSSLPRSTADVALSTNRGLAACKFSKRQRPELETSISQGVEDPRPGSNVRRVRLVLTP